MDKKVCEVGTPCYDKFNFFVPLEIEKSEKQGEDKYDNMFIQGVASTNDEDLEEEVLEPSGFEFSRFLRKGLVNLEHYTARKGSPKYWIGEPVAAKIVGDKFLVKAKLWSKSKLARDFWDTVSIMKESGSDRRPGFSIEGTALLKDPNNEKRILKARINNIAVTFSPVNTNSWLDIVKGQQDKDYVEPVFDESANGGGEYLLDLTKEDGTRILITKDFEIKITKSMNTVSGAALMKESLDDNLKKLQPEFSKSVIKLAESHTKSPFSEEKFKKVKDFIKYFMKFPKN